MGLGELIAQVRSRVRLQLRFELFLLVLAAATYSGVVWLLYDRLLLLSQSVAVGFALVCGALVLLAAWRLKLARGVTELEAAARVDEQLPLKDRAVAYVDLARRNDGSSEGEHRALQELLAHQSVELLPESLSAAQIVPLRPRRGIRHLSWSLPLLWGMIIAVLLGIVPRRYTSTDAAALSALAESATMPEPVKEALRDLASELEQHARGDTSDINSALERAKAEIESAQEELAADSGPEEREIAGADEAQEQGAGPSKKGAAPTPTPTPTPTPPAGQQSSQSDDQKNQPPQQNQDGGEDQNQNSDGGKGGPAHQKPKEGESADNAKQGGAGQGAGSGSGEQKSSSAPKPSQEQQGGGGQQSSDSRSSAGGEGSNKGQKDQQGGASSSSQKQDGDGDDSAGDGDGDQPSESGAAGEKGGGKEGDGQGEQQGANAGGSQQQGLSEAQRQVEQLEQKLNEQGAKSNQSGERQSGDQPKRLEGSGGSPSDSGTMPPDDKPQPSAADRPEGSQGQGSSSSRERSPSTKEQSSSAAPPASQNPETGESGAAQGRGDPTAKRFEDGEGSSGSGLGEKKAFQEREIKATEDKFDSRYTGKESTIAKNTRDARPKTAIRDVELAKPDPIKDTDSQPIPLEYRDVLE